MAWLLPLAAAHSQTIETQAVFSSPLSICASGSCTISCSAGTDPGGLPYGFTYGACTDGTSIPANFTNSDTLSMTVSGPGGNMTATANAASSWTQFIGSGGGGTLSAGDAISGQMKIYARVSPNATVSMLTTISLNDSVTGETGQTDAEAGYQDACSSDHIYVGTYNLSHSCGVSIGGTPLPGTDFYPLNVNLGISAVASAGATGTPNSGSGNASMQITISVQGPVMQELSGSGQTGIVGQGLAQPLTVQVVDGQTGQPVQGVGISFSVTASPSGSTGASVQGSATTDVNGNASTGLTLGSLPGTYSVQAQCGSCMANLTETFNETAETLQQGTGLYYVSGNGSGPVLTTLPNPLVARAMAFGVAQPGLSVTFQSNAPATFLSPTTVTTDDNGVASVSGVTLPTFNGSYSVTATCSACQLQPQVTFLLTAKSQLSNIFNLFPASTYLSSSGVNPAAPPSSNGTQSPTTTPGVDPNAAQATFDQASYSIGFGNTTFACVSVNPADTPPSAVGFSSLNGGFQATQVGSQGGCAGLTIAVKSNTDTPSCIGSDILVASLISNGQVIGGAQLINVLPSENASLSIQGQCQPSTLNSYQLYLYNHGLATCIGDTYNLVFSISSPYSVLGLPWSENIYGHQPIGVFQNQPNPLPLCPGAPTPTPSALVANQPNNLLHTLQPAVVDFNGSWFLGSAPQCGEQFSQDILLGGHFSAPVSQGGILLGGGCFIQTNTLQGLYFRNGTISTRRSDYQGLFQ
jgi:hypothetical protein